MPQTQDEALTVFPPHFGGVAVRQTECSHCGHRMISLPAAGACPICNCVPVNDEAVGRTAVSPTQPAPGHKGPPRLRPTPADTRAVPALDLNVVRFAWSRR